jgi:cysteinyl-tRNA synthetase
MRTRPVLITCLTVAVLITGCGGVSDSDPGGNIDYREEMREFVQDIGAWARASDPGFIVIPQNGHELLTEDGEGGGTHSLGYIGAIDGAGQEELFYGYDGDNIHTPSAVTDYLMEYLLIAESHGIEVLVTDYCWDTGKVDSSYTMNETEGFISFAADHRDLDNIPGYPAQPWNVNGSDIASLQDAANFLYLLDPSLFASRQAYLSALQSTDYDLLIIDLFYEDSALTAGEIAGLGQKQNGGTRILICYMSIGQAEDYRFYWQEVWASNPPSWLSGEDPEWPGNYFVQYWDSVWQALVFGGEGSYLDLILDAGFDGVYLDRIDAFEYWEDLRI